MPRFAAQLAHTATLVEARLSAIVSRDTTRGVPTRLVDATRHAVLGGGKCFRPFLVLESAALFGVSSDDAMESAAAIECVHCYSLVHDDLPAMDNDEVRRGRPTVWKAYDDWTAILAGDGLQALAFELLSDPACHPDARVRAELVLTLAVAAGNAGMVGGQALDLEAERLHATNFSTDARPDVARITRLQAMKTGALIRAACEMGAILGQASAQERAALVRYGEALGLAFQISDDLLDAEGSAAEVGKATGKDAAAGKATLVSLLGLKTARAHLNDTVANAIAALTAFGNRAEVLIEAARFMGRREK